MGIKKLKYEAVIQSVCAKALRSMNKFHFVMMDEANNQAFFLSKNKTAVYDVFGKRVDCPLETVEKYKKMVEDDFANGRENYFETDDNVPDAPEAENPNT